MITPQFRFQIYPGRDKLLRKRWYIRIVGRNNETTFQSTQGHTNKTDAIHICDRSKVFMPSATITVYETDPRK